MRKSFFILLAVLAIQSCQSVLQPSGWDTSKVEIARDEFGVPHIFGERDADVAYGLAWAHAEDDFETIQKTLLAGKGLVGRVYGEEGAAVDFFVQLLETQKIAKAKYGESFSEEFKAVLEGYAAGMNDYAESHPQEILYPGAFPVNPIDITSAYILSLAQMSGADRAVQQIVNGKAGKVLPDPNPKGSNAIAIHSSRTESGENFLAINSHQPLEGPVSWYEAHLHSEEGWNILGGLFPGGAMIFHGVNEHLGWAHTVNFPDLLDTYQLEINPENPGQYKVDEKWLELEERTIWIKVKLWNFITLPVPKKVWKSIYGPTLVTENGTFSIKLGALDRIGAPEQWWRMNKAQNFSEWKAAMESVQLTSFNTVYADKYDTVFYVSNALLPIRNPKYEYTETVPGNTQETYWSSYHTFEDLPQYLNPTSGYLFNTNHSPFTASDSADNLDPNNFAEEMDFSRRENNRSTRFREIMPKEGLLSWEDFERIKFDDQLPEVLAFRTNMDALFSLDPEKFPEIKAQIETLKNWNKRGDINSEGASLFAFSYYYWWEKFEENGRKWETTLSEEEAAEGLLKAKEHFESHFGKELVTLGEYQKLVRGEKALPLWGLDDVITAMRSEPWKNGMRKGVQGESYIMMIRFGEGLPKIETINVFGASNRPDSPHYDDQMERFLARDLKPMSLDKESVLKDAVRVYHPGEE
ncbi:penicillin acylase family protein [Algoriphagus marincola]|uniref:Penicillin acylase family protein n=1 Tax=Algoriphagus marincola TaxID=264027 RepID=A0ABS7N2G6_9BACT|nr:penicillin acylase family protein [Algoriphagus marincola]MBY5949400.1 penicillin acylase family protein [Algoriphagus marincola]